MQAFVTLEAVAAPLPMANVDTDKIIPARFLKTIRRTGLGAHVFDVLRFDETGAERAEFVLNRAPFREARILLAYENFGCGSSREHAPWALLDFGIRCVIAPSFADIFYNNCFKNGILPVVLPRAAVEALMAHAAAPGATVRVDLPAQTVAGGAAVFLFEIDAFRKHVLLHGLDDIGQTLAHEAAIAGFEARVRAERPFLPALHQA